MNTRKKTKGDTSLRSVSLGQVFYKTLAQFSLAYKVSQQMELALYPYGHNAIHATFRFTAG
jgi:hypothetical protein